LRVHRDGRRRRVDKAGRRVPFRGHRRGEQWRGHQRRSHHRHTADRGGAPLRPSARAAARRGRGDPEAGADRREHQPQRFLAHANGPPPPRLGLGGPGAPGAVSVRRPPEPRGSGGPTRVASGAGAGGARRETRERNCRPRRPRGRLPASRRDHSKANTRWKGQIHAERAGWRELQRRVTNYNRPGSARPRRLWTDLRGRLRAGPPAAPAENRKRRRSPCSGHASKRAVAAASMNPASRLDAAFEFRLGVAPGGDRGQTVPPAPLPVFHALERLFVLPGAVPNDPRFRWGLRLGLCRGSGTSGAGPRWKWILGTLLAGLQAT
jgi:hypothetical protein